MSRTKPRGGADNGSRVWLWQRGMYVIAVAIVALFAGLLAYQVLVNGRVARSLIFVSFVGIGLMWRLLRTRGGAYVPPDGLRVTESEPALVKFVREIAETVGSPVPDEIYLVAASDLYLAEDSRAFGLSTQTTALAIGVPLIQVLPTRELAALIAHELAHVGDVGVDRGAQAYRALRYGAELIAVERKGFVNGVFGNYARKMYRSIGGIGRAQEYAADQAAVDAYGTAAVTSALTKYDDVAVAFDQFLREYVVPALQHQVHPVDMFGGFGEMLESEPRRDQRAADLVKRREKVSGEFELHATPIERLAHLASIIPAAASPASDGSSDLDDRPAVELLDEAARSGEILVGQWAAGLIGARTEPRPWSELGDAVFESAIATVARIPFDDRKGGPEVDPDADELDRFDRTLELSSSGDWAATQRVLDKRLKKISDPHERLEYWATAVVTAAAAAHDGFTCVHSWHGPPELHTPTGQVFDGSHIAKLVVDGDAAEARRAFEAAVATS